MKDARYLNEFSAVICILSLSFFLFIGCGASRQKVEGQDVNIDDLLGEGDITKTSQNSDEEEVLRLLGISRQDTQPVETTTATPAPDESLQSDVDALQEDLLQKEREISTLRSEITQKESKISELESQLQASSRRSNSVSRSGRYADAPPEFVTQYQAALNQFNARSYRQAMAAFSALLASDANNSLSDNCQYWIGECYYALGDYNQAIAEFEKVFSFPNSNKSDDAQLKLGLCYMKLGERQQARAEFERLIASYPQSEYVPLAQRYMARL